MTRTGIVALLIALAGCPAPQVGTVTGPGPGDPVVAEPTAEPTPDPTPTPTPPADRDGDGFADADDRCPDAIELMNGYQDNDGCPDDPPRIIVGGPDSLPLEIVDHIYFHAGSAILDKGTLPMLDQIVAYMRDHPRIGMVEIQGHTDGREKGRKLDVARAEAAMKYLIAHGVGPERLVAKGYGATQPLDAAKTDPARARNRRVDFQVTVVLDRP